MLTHGLGGLFGFARDQYFGEELMPARRNILARRYADARSRAGPAFEQTLELESQQSFGYRQETHAQLRRNFAAGNDLPKGEMAAKDPLLHELVGFTGKACRRCSLSHENSSHQII